MTGILPIKKYAGHCALNMFDEFTAARPLIYGQYLGFTADEVKKLCDEFKMPFIEISDWYGGYIANDVGTVFNPRSVVSACRFGQCDSYWASTETYEALQVYISMDYDGLRSAITRLLAGGREKVDMRHFTNDMTTMRSSDDVLTLLIHLGYLAYNSETSEVFIPNKEIREKFVSAMSEGDWR